jgi:N-acyl-D-aspartate/D-glutamate deacylase
MSCRHSKDRRAALRGGTVIDGTGAPRYAADVRIVDGRIAESAPASPRTIQRRSTQLVASSRQDIDAHAR